MGDALWNPWHGCHKLSEGCRNCYVYRIDSRHERDASVVTKNKSFSLPITKNRRGEYKYPSGTTFYTCFSSDFFVEDADQWRTEAWDIMRERCDCRFFFITKRIDRFEKCIPDDWGGGWDHVKIAVTCENQKMTDYRMPIYLSLPIKHRAVICEPLLGEIDIERYLTPEIASVTVGGESGNEARICDFRWVLSIREQCIRKGVPFHFKQTGARFLKDGRLYRIPKPKQGEQARRAGINT